MLAIKAVEILNVKKKSKHQVEEFFNLCPEGAITLSERLLVKYDEIVKSI